MQDRTQARTKDLGIIVGSYVYSGIVLNLLKELKTIISSGAYTALIASVVALIIAISFRLGFGDLIEKLRNIERQRRTKKTKVKLVKDWCSTFTKLCDILNEAIRADQSPTDEQERQYLKLRTWLRKHRPDVLPTWQVFKLNRTPQAYEELCDSLEFKYVFEDNDSDPFSCFYEPLSLVKLKDIMNIKHWSEDRLRFAFHMLEEQTDEFVQWQASR